MYPGRELPLPDSISATNEGRAATLLMQAMISSHGRIEALEGIEDARPSYRRGKYTSRAHGINSRNHDGILTRSRTRDEPGEACRCRTSTRCEVRTGLRVHGYAGAPREGK